MKVQKSVGIGLRRKAYSSEDIRVPRLEMEALTKDSDGFEHEHGAQGMQVGQDHLTTEVIKSQTQRLKKQCIQCGPSSNTLILSAAVS